jgi:hypothetical protein
VLQKSQAKLPEMTSALDSAGRLPRCLDRWEEEGNENSEDRDDDQQLDDRETVFPHEALRDAATDGDPMRALSVDSVTPGCRSCVDEPVGRDRTMAKSRRAACKLVSSASRPQH